MELFALDDEVIRLEALLPSQIGPARLDVLVALAWHLRQRDTQRALALADQALAMNAADGSSARILAVSARLNLIRADAHWLYAELDAAEAHCLAALDACTQQGDALGCADAHWLLAGIKNDRGQSEQRDASLEAAANAARSANDDLRADIAEATLAFMTALRDMRGAIDRWGKRFHANMEEPHPALAARVYDYLGVLASLSSDFGKAAMFFARTSEAAQKSGQIRRAILATLNTGDAFNSLNDHHAALEWMQRGLDLARKADWNVNVGVCLTQTAETLRRLGRLEPAQELLNESLAIMSPLSGSRDYAVALSYSADLALDRRDYNAALENFLHLEVRANALNQVDLQIDAHRGQAHALSELSQPQAALAAATTALQLAKKQKDASREIAVLLVLADIYTRHQLPELGLGSEPGLGLAMAASRHAAQSKAAAFKSANTALHFLRQALAVSDTIDGYTIPHQLLDAIARQYAALGDFTEAYQTSLKAINSREKTHSKEATNRAIAMQVRHQTESAQAEREHHRELAISEAQRAHALHQNSITLERLGTIGQEITAHLDTQDVLHIINRHVHGLLDVDSFAIYLLDPDGLHLNLAFGIEGEHILGAAQVALSDPHASSARCVRESREIAMDCQNPTDSPNRMPGTSSNTSGLFAPLMIGERILGVMTLQAQSRHAYNARERLIFRTLCAYGAIALDNANTYQQLQQTQTQLAAQEKLAALGALVAGVAHELNTPIGNSLLMASALEEKTDAIDAKIQAHTIQQSDLNDFLSDAQEASTVIMRSLTSAAELVNSFKQVAMDRTTAQRRVFDLQQTCHEILATMMRHIRLSGHAIELDIPANISMNGYPGPFGQVIGNLVNNAMLHAFDGRTDGRMRLVARLKCTGRVLITFQDDGAGISKQNIGRIFDPFFTTKMGQGGNGLGLNISYNIITSLLNGQIKVDSKPGTGTCFTLDLPLTVPAQ
jgi:signal transduction histidine kinase